MSVAASGQAIEMEFDVSCLHILSNQRFAEPMELKSTNSIREATVIESRGT